MFIVFFRAVILYVIIIISMRLMGKRQLGELQPSELVITLLMSNIATLPVEDTNIPMIMGIVPIFTLVCLDVFLSHLSMKSRKLRKLISGSPKIIISEGKIDKKIMRDLRFTIDDLTAALRSVSVFDINDVQLAVVETTGKISVYQKQEVQPVTAGYFDKNIKNNDPPQLIIDDGDIAPKALAFLGFDKKWLDNILAKEKLTSDNVFIMTADRSGNYTIIKTGEQN